MEIKPADILNAPNAISAAGFALVVDGSRHMDEPIGLAKVAAGRALDLVDGHVARATGQTSEFGAATDATLDKVGVGFILGQAWRNDIAPKPAIAAIAVHNVANAAATTIATHRHPDRPLKPTRAGKVAMALENVGLLSYAIGTIAEKREHVRTAQVARGIGHAATIVGVGVFGTKATYDYFRRALSD